MPLRDDECSDDVLTTRGLFQTFAMPSRSTRPAPLRRSPRTFWQCPCSSSYASVYCFVPNVIGYVRLISICVMVSLHEQRMYDHVFVAYVLGVCLDFFDGFLARMLNQTSKFGEFLDVFADNAMRTCMWMFVMSTRRLGSYVGPLCVVVEWTCFVCAHEPFGRNWKSISCDHPEVVRVIFSNGFKNPLGALAITGLFTLPLLVYLEEFVIDNDNHETITRWMLSVVKPLLLFGRALSALCEFSIIRLHVVRLVRSDANTHSSA